MAKFALGQMGNLELKKKKVENDTAPPPPHPPIIPQADRLRAKKVKTWHLVKNIINRAWLNGSDGHELSNRSGTIPSYD